MTPTELRPGDPVDLTNCDREPIHIPGAVQPHGMLFGLTEPGLRVAQVSANTADHLGVAHDRLLGAALDEVLDPAGVAAVRLALAEPDPRGASPLRLRARGDRGGRRFDGILHRSGGLAVLELEPGSDDGVSFGDFYRGVRGALARLQRAVRVVEMCQLAAAEVAALTGFDRVMVYRFDPDGHGHVIAETKRDGLEPYLDLHYPASDIPAQARRLYLLNWLRLIVDVDYRPSPVAPAANPLTGAPLDLSYSVLRSVSPIHVEYLRNMGIHASMSVSLVVDGALWGLAICHHYAPRFVPYDVRVACEFLGQALSWQVAARERAEAFERRAAAQHALARLTDRLAAGPDVAGALGADPDALLALVGASGAAFRLDGAWTVLGRAPPADALDALARSLPPRAADAAFATDSLARLDEGARRYDVDASGALAAGLGGDDLLVWTRPEAVQTVDWAGDPQKSITVADGHARLSPRGSFALWRETVRSRSAPWQPWEVEAATDFGRVVAGFALRRRLARAEAARGEAEANEGEFRALAETMPQMVWRAGPDGGHDYFNARWYDFTGLAPGQSDGAGWADPLHPDDRERSRARWTESLRTGEPYEIEYRFRRRDGAYEWFLGRALARRDEAGAVVAWFGTCTNIDAQKRAEQSLRVLAAAGATLASPLDAAPTLQHVATLVVPALADWSTVHLRDDRGQIALVAAAHADPAKTDALWDALGRPTPDDAPHGYAAVMRSGASELRADVGDEPLADAASVMTVPLAVGGRTFGALGLGSGRRYGPDDLRLAEEIGRRVAVALDNARLFALAQAERQRAEAASRAKDEFLSVASHELRTPLNAILGWARMLRSGSLPDDKRGRALETIERNARVQVQLVDDILDVSRIVTGKLRLSVAPVEAAEIVEAATDVMRPAAEAKGVRIQLLLDPDAGTIHGDAARLQQVVWNLLANAVKFTPKGGRVHVRLQRESSDVELTVADTGQGIEGPFLPHVFEPFRQADSSVTRSQGGLGLGLAIVKHLVELHGGRIEAHSEGAGRGATFTLRIPIAPVRRVTSAPGAEALPRPAHESPRLSCPPGVAGLRVLVVDDEPDTRELVQAILEQCGAVVSTAGSAEEALAMLRAAPPGVLLSDIGMPGEDGYGLIRRVRALPPAEGGRTPAVALTAFARMEDRTRALMEGFTSHLAKPVEPQELLAVVASVAGWPGARP